MAGQRRSQSYGEASPGFPPELALEVLSEGVTDVVTVLDSEGSLLYANEVAARRSGYENAQEMLEHPTEWMERVTFLDREGNPLPFEDLPGRRVIRGEQPEPLLIQVLDRANGKRRWALVKAKPFFGPSGELNYVVNTIQDETARIEAEEEARGRAENQAFLVRSAKELGRSLDVGMTMQRVADLLVSRLADWCVIDLLNRDGEIGQFVISHADPRMVEEARELRKRFPPDRSSNIGVWGAIRSGRTQTFEVTDEVLMSLNIEPDFVEELKRLEIRSSIIVPLTARGKTLGAVTLVWTQHDHAAINLDAAMLEEFAALAGLALDNVRLFAEKDEIARTLQSALMPASLPTVAGFELAASYWAPAGPVEVGGDFYDAFDRPEGALGIVVGDVCGKGAQAAAVMGVARQTVRAAGVREDRPSEILRVLNEALLRDQSDLFCTAADLRIQPGRGRAQFAACVAGHPSPILLRKDGTLERIQARGAALGITEKLALEDRYGELLPGDMVLLFTDGLVEFRGKDLQEPFEELLRENRDASATELVAAIGEWHAQRSISTSGDDAVILVARFTG
jgi:PAS domain S-box-containing protein